MQRAMQWTTTGLAWALLASAAHAQSPAPASAAQPAAVQAAAPTPVAAAAASTAADGGSFDLAAVLAEGGEPMTADRAAELARASAPSVESARAQSRAALAAAGEAVVAAYPRLDLEARYTRLSEVDPPNLPGLPPELFEQFLDRYALEARLSYPVSDLFFSILPRYRAARDGAEVERLNAEARAHTAALSAREALYNYARAKAARSVAQTGLAQSQAQLVDVRAFVAAGSLARVEEMRADAQVASAQVALARADASVQVARTALLTLLHQPDRGELSVRDDVSAALPALQETEAQLVDQAMRRRAEVRALRQLLDVQQTQIEAYDADGLPHLGVGATLAYENPTPPRVIPPEREWTATWALTASLSWSPSQLAAGNAGADRVSAQRESTAADLRALEDAVRVEVSQAVAAYEAARRATEAAQVGVAAADESFRVRREQFRAGAAVSRDVIDAEAEQRRARLQLVDAAIDARIARARLDRAVER